MLHDVWLLFMKKKLQYTDNGDGMIIVTALLKETEQGQGIPEHLNRLEIKQGNLPE